MPLRLFDAFYRRGGARRGGYRYAVTTARMQDEMIGSHESLIEGINPAWSWGSNPRVGYGLTGYPGTWTVPAFTAWGIIGAPQGGAAAANVRVQIKNLIADYRVSGVWQRAQETSTGITGATYTNYETNTSIPADEEQLGDEGISVLVPMSGGTYHFYPNFRVAFPTSGLQAIVTSMDVRLIKGNPAGADDWDAAPLYGCIAGDIYQNMSAVWPNNGDSHIGKFRRLTRGWRTITSHVGLSTQADYDAYVAWARAFLAPAASGGVTVHQVRYATNGVPQETIAVSLDTTPTTGRMALVLAIAVADTNTNLTCTDNQGNTYTATGAVQTAAGGRLLRAWTAPINTASGTFTVTVDSTGGSSNSSYYDVIVLEISGQSGTPVISTDKFEFFVNYTPFAFDIASLPVPGCLVAALCTYSGSDTIAAGSGWTAASGSGGRAIYRTAASAGNADPSWTWSGSGTSMYGLVVAIRPA